MGLLLQAARERSNTLGRIVVGFIGIGWSLMTYLVVPVLVSRNLGPVDAIKESASILKRTWGEQIVGTAGVGFVFTLLHIGWTLLMVPCFILAGMSGLSWLMIPLAVVAVAGYLTLTLLGATLSGIYSAALYRFATTGRSAMFEQDLLEGAFRRDA